MKLNCVSAAERYGQPGPGLQGAGSEPVGPEPELSAAAGARQERTAPGETLPPAEVRHACSGVQSEAGMVHGCDGLCRQEPGAGTVPKVSPRVNNRLIYTFTFVQAFVLKR